MSSYRAAIVAAPLLAISLAAIAYGETAAGIVAAAWTLILWAVVLRFFRPEPPAVEHVRPPSRPVFVGPAPALPPSEKEARIARVADDPRTPPGERAAAREALRRIRVR